MPEYDPFIGKLVDGWRSEGVITHITVNSRTLSSLFFNLITEMDRRGIEHSRQIVEEEMEVIDPTQDIRSIEQGIRLRLRERYG